VSQIFLLLLDIDEEFCVTGPTSRVTST